MTNTKLTVDDFINESGLDFTDISTEAVRRYHYQDGGVEEIVGPLLLNVSRSGGHRIFDENGISHYIRSGWRRISWIPKPGKANFVK